MATETDRRPVLPAKFWLRPDGDPYEADQEARGRSVLVVLPVQADPGALIQALLNVASAAKKKAMWHSGPWWKKRPSVASGTGA